MKDIKARVITSVSSFVIFLVVLFSDYSLIFVSFMSVVIAACLGEFFNLAKVENKKLRILGATSGAILPILYFFQQNQYFFLLPLVILTVLFFSLLIEAMHRSKTILFYYSSLLLWGLIFLGVTLTFFMPLYFSEDGPKIVLYVVLVVKLNDVVAYLVGSSWNKLKLFPRISPSKSWSGFLAGLLTSIIAAVGLGKYLANFYFPLTFVLGICLGVLGPAGDLAASMIKRRNGAKHSGFFLPGIGGLLDGVDSLLFTVPFFYYFSQICGK